MSEKWGEGVQKRIHAKLARLAKKKSRTWMKTKLTSV